MAVDNRNTLRAVLLGIAVLAVVLRLAFALGYWTGQPLTRDEREYLSGQLSIKASKLFENFQLF